MISGSFYEANKYYGYETTKKYDDNDLEIITNNLLDKLHISNKPVLVKCPACGQWAAVQTACKSCGHPVG